MTVDGLSLYSSSIAIGATGTLVTGAQLDTAWTTFAAANTGYTLSAGTFAAGTAVITKADGTAITLAQTQVTGTGATASAVAIAGVGFIGTTAAAGAAVAAVAADNHGTITLSSNNAAGIVLADRFWVGKAGLQQAQPPLQLLPPLTTVATIDISTAAGALAALSDH